jgi:hypothetical protein
MLPEVRRRVIREVVVVLAAIVVGAILFAIKAGTAATAAGIVIMGLAFVAATAFVFMEIGFSEDRERAETERRRNQPWE